MVQTRKGYKGKMKTSSWYGFTNNKYNLLSTNSSLQNEVHHCNGKIHLMKYFIPLHDFNHEPCKPSLKFVLFQSSRGKLPGPLSAVKSQSHSSGRCPSLEWPGTSIACNGDKCTPSQEGVKRDERPFYVTQIVRVNYF